MALSARQHNLLAEMGIPVWVRREPATQPAEQLEQAPQKTSVVPEPQPMATDSSVTKAIQIEGELLVVVAGLPLQQQEQLLLGAMLKAVSLTPEQVTTLTSEQFARVDAEKIATKPCLLFGEPSNAQHEQHITIASLSDMLNNPMLKARAWQALKQLSKAF